MSEGASLQDREYIQPNCPSCRRGIPVGSNFCPHCGARLGGDNQAPYRPPPTYQPPPPTATLLDLGRGIASYTTLVLVAFIAVNIGILVGSVGLVSEELVTRDFSLFIVTPWVVDIVEIGGEVLVAYFLFLVVAIVASFLWMIRRSIPGFTHELRMRVPTRGHTPVYVVATLFFTLIAFNFYYYIILGVVGINPSSPSFDEELWKLIFSFANASVWEELITRVLLIGVPLIFVDLLRKRGMRWRSYVLGGGFEIRPPELVLLLFSSAMFALAHVGSWDAFKTPPTLVAGVVLGYLFLRVGLYAAIMVHFSVDFMSMPIEVTQSMGVTLVIGVLALVWIAVGTCYLVYYSTRVTEFLLRRKLWPPRILAPPAVIPPYRPVKADGPPVQTEAEPRARNADPDQGFRYSCRYCGNTEARYKDGELYCLRCGRKD